MTSDQRPRKKKPKKTGDMHMMKQYEKNRRDRINMKLETLASMLPHYSKENPWQKKEIIENAIEFLLSAKADRTENQELMRKMFTEIKALKDIILAFSEFKYLKYDIFKLSSVEIRVILKQLSENNCKLLDKDKVKNIAPKSTNYAAQHREATKKRGGIGQDTMETAPLVGEEHSYSSNNKSSQQQQQPKLQVQPEPGQRVEVEAAGLVLQPEGPRMVYVHQPPAAVKAEDLPKLYIGPQPVQAQLDFSKQQQQPVLATPAVQKVYLQQPALPPLLDGQSQLFVTRGKQKNLILNGTQVIQLIPGGAVVKVSSAPTPRPAAKPIQDLGRSIVTSTVTVNSGPKVSLIELKRTKRPYRKRKLKTDTSKPEVVITKPRLDPAPEHVEKVPEGKELNLEPAPSGESEKVSSEMTDSFEGPQLGIQQDAAILVDGLRDTLNDTLDEQLETSLEAVEHLNPGDVVPLQEREHLNSSFSAQLEASLDEEVSGSLQFTNLDQAQSSKELGDLVVLEKCEGGDQKKQLQEKRLEELKMINETIKEENIKETVELKREQRRGEKKKKSSYSIPALCQISVNIGDRPDIAGSPGVLSLNSVGTISPRHTPTPDKSTLDNIKNTDDPVIEELKTIRPEELLQVEIVTGADDQNKTSSIPSSHSISSSLSSSHPLSSNSLPSSHALPASSVSPSQTFLTSFPHVSKHSEQEVCEGVNIQVELSQALTDLGREFNLETINSVQDIKELKEDAVLAHKPETPSKNSAPGSVTAVDQSVYDFSCKPNSPPVPLHKARKDSRSPRQAKEEYSRSSKQEIKEQKPAAAVGTSAADFKPKSAEKKAVHPSHSATYPAHQLDSYDARLVNQQVKQTNYSHSIPTTYHPNHAIPRHSYMGSHYQYQGNQHSYHPYSQPVPVTAAEMKDQAQSFHQDSKYSSCPTHTPYPAANIQDFHSRNYYKNYNTAQHYRGFQESAVHQQYNPERKHRQLHQQVLNQQQQQQQLMVQDAGGGALPDKGSVDQDMAGSFSVTQLVNTSQRRTSKKTSNPATKPRGKADGDRKEKDEKRKGTSRRNRSGNRSNYSAESLSLSAQGQVTFTTPDPAKDDMKTKISPLKNQKMSGASDKVAASSSGRSNVNWSNEMNQHFSSLPFSSLSPSPGLFSTDLSSFEIGIFQQQEGNSRDYFNNQVSNQPTKSSKTCQLGNQRTADWGINSGAIPDGSFLPPLPTLTPPTLTPPTDDPYAFMSHSHSGFYPCASVPAQRSQNVYSSHPPNLPVSGCATPSSMMKGSSSHQGFPAQMFGISALGGGKVSSNTGSLVNFNLSTIFPEINIPQAPGPNCQSKPLVGIPAMPPPEFLQGPRSGQLGTPEHILPHSISLLGHSSQVPTFTSTISSNMLPLTNLSDREY